MKNLSRRQFMKVIGLGTLAGTAALAVAGCSKDNETTDSNQVNTPEKAAAKDVYVTAGTTLEVTSLAPWIKSFTSYSTAAFAIYPALAAYDYMGSAPHNYMIKTLTQVGDNDYEIELWDNIIDSEGNSLNAYDVEYSYTKCAEFGNINKRAYCTHIEATGDYTLKFSVKSGAPGVLADALNKIFIVSQKAYEASADGFASAPVGAGAYEIDEFVSGSYIKLKKKENFWIESEDMPKVDKPNADYLYLRFIADASQRCIALEEGSIDIDVEVPINDAQRLEGAKGIVVETIPSQRVWTLFFNMLKGSVFADNVNLRKAVLYALDSEAIAIGGAGRGGAVVDKGFGCPVCPDYPQEWSDASYDYFNYNVDTAKKYLADAGYSAGELTVKLVGQYEASKSACEVIQANLSAIGINVQIECPDSGIFSSVTDADSGAWDMIFMFYGASNGVAGLYNYCLNLDNRTTDYCFNGLKDEVLQAAIIEAMAAPGPDQSKKVQKILDDNAYLYSVYTPNAFCAHVDGISELVLTESLNVQPFACVFDDSFVGVNS